MRKAIILLLLGVAVTAIYYLLSSKTEGELAISNLEFINSITIGDTAYVVQGGEITTTLKPGEYTIVASGPMLKEKLVESVEVSSSARKSISLQPILIDEEQLVNKLTEEEMVSNGLSVSAYHLSQDQLWLAVRMYSESGKQEGYTNIYKFSGSNGWKLIESGTGVDFSSLLASGIPSDSIDFLEGKNQ